MVRPRDNAHRSAVVGHSSATAPWSQPLSVANVSQNKPAPNKAQTVATAIVSARHVRCHRCQGSPKGQTNRDSRIGQSGVACRSSEYKFSVLIGFQIGSLQYALVLQARPLPTRAEIVIETIHILLNLFGYIDRHFHAFVHIAVFV